MNTQTIENPKLRYAKPMLQRIGSIEEMTQATGTGTRIDLNEPSAGFFTVGGEGGLQPVLIS